MKIVGLTGGIGSGKTTVATMFKKMGVPVYIADDEAKKLINSSDFTRKQIIKLLGKESFIEKALNRSFVADKIFNDKKLLDEMNKIIHPKVAQHFTTWLEKQKGVYCIKEAAILFENGSYRDCDFTILVTAPLNERIQRVLKRDHSSLEKIESRIKNQWSDEKKEMLADFILENKNLEFTQRKAKELHLFLLKTLN